MRILVTGVTGYVGGALAERLHRGGHEVRGFARDAARVRAPLAAVVEGDAVTGAGLDRALDGADVAYYLIHSMERASASAFDAAERAAAEHFAAAAAAAGVRRVVYLGGLVPEGVALSRHLRSRLGVEEVLLSAGPEAVALRASIVVGARSRSFRLLVRLVERLPVLALPSWREHRTRPVDGRDVLDFLQAAATLPSAHAGRSWDVAGPDEVSYGELMRRIAEAMMVARPTVDLPFSLTPVASVLAAAVAEEDAGLVTPLMESLEHDLLPRHLDAAATFGVRPRRLGASLERALRDLDATGAVAAR